MTTQQHNPLDPDEQQLVDDVREHGWHALWIEDDDDRPGFNYSVGLQATFDHAEVVMFGLDRSLMHDVMWGMVEDIQNGRRFEQAGLYEGLLEGCACAIREVHPSQHTTYLGYALWYHRYRKAAGEVRAVQVFWPSKVDGLFPWEDGCAAEVRELQPRLDLEAEGPAEGEGSP